MTWNQYRDTTHKVADAFGVHAIPHYFTIDSEGVLTAEDIGSESMSDSRIDKLVRRAREQAASHRSNATMARNEAQ